jgi:hypothetical protein
MKNGYPVAGQSRREGISMVTRLAPIGGVDTDKRTVNLVWTTGGDVLRYDPWEGKRYIERLRVDMASCHLECLNAGAPLLNSHQALDLSDQIGVVESAEIANGEGRAVVRFPKAGIDANADAIFSKVQDGIVRNVSVGYIVNRYEITDNQGSSPDVWTAVDWTPRELSLVTIPADTGAGTRSAIDPNGTRTYACEFVMRAAPAQPKEANMAVNTDAADGPATQTAVPPQTGIETRSNPPAPNPAAAQHHAVTGADRRDAVSDAVVAERARVQEIVRRTIVAGLPQEVADDLIARGIAVDNIGNCLIDEMAKRGTTPAFAGAHTPAGGIDAVETRRSAVSEAMLNRAFPNIKDFAITDRAREWRGFDLSELSRALLSDAGVRTRGLSKAEICTRALTTGDFPFITANVMNRSLQAGYAAEVRTFALFSTVRNAGDFKDIYSLQFGEGSNLDEVGQDAEYKYASVGEDQETWKLRKFGKILPITYETLINDDLNAFGRVPYNFGQAAVRKENDIVWGLLTANVTMRDGNALFSAKHSNLITGADNKVSLTGLQAMRGALRKQLGLDGNQKLNLRLKYVAVGSDQETALEQIMSPMLFASQTANVVPEFYRSLVPIVESRIDDLGSTGWFGMADPAQISTIEYGYLDGQQGVYLETKDGFERDGIQVKVRHVFGAGAVNWRGMAYATGKAA